jgi:serine/threonine protein phosphatase PrpC
MWRFVSACAIGTSHLKTNLPCQDRLACEALTGGALVAAVADGAGSAAMGGRGAEIAVLSVIEYLKGGIRDGRTDFDNLLREAAALARDAIADEANREGTALRSYASTLLTVVPIP